MSKRHQDRSPTRGVPSGQRYAAGWALGLGLLLATAMLKFGNPVILAHLVARPEGWAEWMTFAWPLGYGYGFLALVVLTSFPLCKGNAWSPRWLWGLALAWLVWQGLATGWSIDRTRSIQVLVHYAGAVLCFGLGSVVLGRMPDRTARWFWLGLLAGFVWALVEGFGQHYGGLAATRESVYARPDWQALPPDFLKRLERDRVFSTFFYANTFAGVILLLLPALVWICWQAWPERLRLFRSVSTGLLVYAGLACLYWTGSKAGWLIAIAVAAVAALHGPASRRLKAAVVVVGLLVGLVGFGVRFQDYFRRGATSAAARLDYWTVAGQVVVERPLGGSGPGTFERLYRNRKPPEAEMTRLVHNDYLQQASDSGIPGALFFAGWIVASLVYGYRGARRGGLDGMVWLGLLAWALQGSVEFGLFIPAIAWVAMVLLGWRTAREYSDRQIQTALLASDHS